MDAAPDTPPTDPSAPAPALGFIFVTLLLDVLGFGLIIPVAPRLIAEIQGEGTSAASYTFGLLTATYAAMQFLFAPILGSLSDRFGRRPVILIALLGSGIDYFALALAPNLVILFITRAINGISGANYTACSAYVADVTPPQKRAAGFGLMGAAFGIGFVLGPLLGGELGKWDLRAPFYAAGAITLLNWLWGLWVLPESLPRERRRSFTWAKSNPVGAFAMIGRYPVVRGLAATLFLFNVAQFGLHVVWVLYTGHRYGWTPREVGWSLAVVGIGSAVVQGGLTRRIVPRLGEPRSLLLGLVLGIAAYAGYGLATQGWMIYTIIAIASLGAISGPAAQSIITRTVRADEQGETQGALASLQSVAQIIGPVIAGSLFGYFISERAPIYLPGAPFFMGAVLATIGTGVALATLRVAGGAGATGNR